MKVTQEWIDQLSLMQQTVLLTAIRGADTLPKYHFSKYLLRWYRRCILISAFDRCVLTDPHDPRGGSFAGPIKADSLDDLASRYLRGVDEIPLHFHMHFIHAAQILGYKHPTNEIRNWWHSFYIAAVRDLHLKPESEHEMDTRLADKLDQWQQLGGDGEVLTGRLPKSLVPNLNGDH
jgi:hypothetical protein